MTIFMRSDSYVTLHPPIASSSVIFRGGCKNTFSSAAVVRMFVSFFSRTGLT